MKREGCTGHKPTVSSELVPYLCFRLCPNNSVRANTTGEALVVMYQASSDSSLSAPEPIQPPANRMTPFSVSSADGFDEVGVR